MPRVHLMELPRKILIGWGILDELGAFISDLGLEKTLLIVSGENVKGGLGDRISEALKAFGYGYEWFTVEQASLEGSRAIEARTRERGIEALIGFGGGKAVDLAKLASYHVGIPFLSVPTCASHDGISSPFVSIKGLDRPYSIQARPPVGIFADLEVISRAPPRLIPSGCGDLLAKLTAVRDWTLARDTIQEYFGNYSSSLALMSAEIVLSNADSIGKRSGESVRDVVEALISAGVAAGIAGSSRPCSGSEHLFSHALSTLAPGKALHGEMCGLGTIVMSKLHGLDWEQVADALRKVGAPTKAKELGISDESVVDALLLAPKIRPERFTILSKVELDRGSAYELATSVGLI